MAKRKSNFSEGKQNIIKALLDEYDIQSAFPKTEYQRCIVHQVRNTLKYVADKDKKKFAEDLKTHISSSY